MGRASKIKHQKVIGQETRSNKTNRNEYIDKAKKTKQQRKGQEKQHENKEINKQTNKQSIKHDITYGMGLENQGTK